MIRKVDIASNVGVQQLFKENYIEIKYLWNIVEKYLYDIYSVLYNKIRYSLNFYFSNVGVSATSKSNLSRLWIPKGAIQRRTLHIRLTLKGENEVTTSLLLHLDGRN